MEPTPKSLILDLLTTTGRAAVPVRALVEAAELFGIAGNALRVALARLHASGLVARDERGRYRLGVTAHAVSQQIVSWRQLEGRVRPWSGGWVAVHHAGSRASRRRARALRLLGFRPLSAGLDVRPDNLRGGVPAVRDQLATLGLEPGVLVFGVTLDGDDDAAARSLWDADSLRATYREMIARLDASAARLPDLPRAQAMRESFVLGGEGIRHLVLDPLLPEPLAPAEQRQALIESMRRYDDLGRRCWAGWLGDDSLPEQSPADVRGLDAAQRVLGGSEGEDHGSGLA